MTPKLVVFVDNRGRRYVRLLTPTEVVEWLKIHEGHRVAQDGGN